MGRHRRRRRVGPTALYHYFESKQHCLYVLIDEAIEKFRRRFVALTEGTDDPLEALTAVLNDVFDLSGSRCCATACWPRNRDCSGAPLLAARGGGAADREGARARARLVLASFLAGAMRAGVIPEADPRLLTRAILGLYNSVWQWYRPAGTIPLQPIADFYKDRVAAMIGVAPGGAVQRRMVA